MAPDLSVCIAARNEEFLNRTVQDVLDHAELSTEVIVLLDDCWPHPEPLADNPRVTIIHHTGSVGQRQGYNEAVALSRARFVMKLDAHCILDQGFDRKLIEPYDKGELKASDVTVPRMYNAHIFDWVCEKCGKTRYQSPPPKACGTIDVVKVKGEPDKEVFREGSGCGMGVPHRKQIVWQPRARTQNDLFFFDNTLHFQYLSGKREWRDHRKAWDARAGKADIVETMSCIGACWLMTRERHHALGGLDEGHGSWGQVGTELGCKAWLSGGRLVTNRRTWFAHFFRCGGIGFPYDQSGNAQERAREYSRWLWRGGHWPGAKYPLQWLVDHFAPVPTWDAATEKVA